jgi:hypothetical protein
VVGLPALLQRAFLPEAVSRAPPLGQPAAPTPAPPPWLPLAPPAGGGGGEAAAWESDAGVASEERAAPPVFGLNLRPEERLLGRLMSLVMTDALAEEVERAREVVP